jgi:hypothetical protein
MITRKGEQRLLLTSISTIIINTHYLSLHFVITSRLEPHICSSFDSPELRHICYYITLTESFKPVEDVVVFLRSKFDKIYNKMVAGMGQLKFIDDEDCRPTDQLKAELDSDISGSLFSDLDQLYQQILLTSPNVPLLLGPSHTRTWMYLHFCGNTICFNN